MQVKIKKSMSTLDIHSWLKGVKDRILNCFIDNIYTYHNNLVVLKLRCKDYTVNLVAEAGKRIHLSKYSYKSHDVSYKMPAFCTILRRKIRDKRILNIYQYDFERIVIIEIGRTETEYKLIVELLPRGTITLVDKDNVIIYASEFKEMKDRSIKLKAVYKYPPKIGIDIITLSSDLFVKQVRSQSEKTIVRGLVKALGIPGELSEELSYRAGVKKDTKIKDLDDRTLEKMFKKLKEIIEESTLGKGYIVYISDTPVTVTPYKPHIYEEGKVVEYTSFNEALDEYFTYYMRIEETRTAKEKMEAELSKLRVAISRQHELLNLYKKESERLRKIADKLITQLHILSAFLDCIRHSKENWYKAIEKCKNILNNSPITIKDVKPDKGVIVILVNGEEAHLNIRLPAYDNISQYYDMAKEYKRKAERAIQAIHSLEEKVKELESRKELAETKARVAIKRKEWFEKYHWLITSSGCLVIAGRDQAQNESLVRKRLKDNDIFLHADIHGAPATILKAEGKKPTNKDIEEAALLAAVYSKAWKLGLHAIDVFWVYGKQVSKSPPSGEYLPKGAFMIYGKKNYIRNVNLIFALGIEIIDNTYRVIVGPEEVVKERTKYYVLLAPGNEEPKTLAEKIKKILLSQCSDERKHIIKAVDIMDIMLKIPGKSRIILRK